MENRFLEMQEQRRSNVQLRMEHSENAQYFVLDECALEELREIKKQLVNIDQILVVIKDAIEVAGKKFAKSG